MNLRLAVIVSHPIQYFAPWYREIARLGDIDLHVFFCCDWGLSAYIDPQFQVRVKWDIPLLEGYASEFLPIRRNPRRLGFWEVDNPEVATALERFNPDVIQVFGYAHRTNWKVVRWAKRRRKPVLLFSDSNASAHRVWWKRAAKQIVVRHFYNYVDGAFCIGDNNRSYHLDYGLPISRLFPGMMPIDQTRLLSCVTDRTKARLRVRRLHKIPEDAFVVLLCGKYMAHKRPLDLVDAAWRVARRGLPVWTLLVGEGPERATIEAFCHKYRITNVIMTGFINQSNIAEYYVASDITVLPSSHEPYGLAISEGALFGLPVIVSDQVGCVGDEGLARPDVNAIVYSCGDRQRLSEAIEALFCDKTLYTQMSRSSLKIAESQDVTVAAKALRTAAFQLKELGPR